MLHNNNCRRSSNCHDSSNNCANSSRMNPSESHSISVAKIEYDHVYISGTTAKLSKKSKQFAKVTRIYIYISLLIDQTHVSKLYYFAQQVESNHSDANRLQVWSLHPGPPRFSWARYWNRNELYIILPSATAPSRTYLSSLIYSSKYAGKYLQLLFKL